MSMMRLAVLTLGAMLLSLGAFAGQAASPQPAPALDLRDYTTELARLSAAAVRLEEHPQEAADLRKQLPDHWSVVVQQQQFVVPTQWLGAALDKLVANPQRASESSREISGRLKSMLQDSQDLAQMSGPGSPQPRAKLDAILKRPEYRALQETGQEEESFWDQLGDWFWRFLDRIFSRAGSHPVATKVLLWSVVVALGLIFLGWLIYSLANLSPSRLFLRPAKAPQKPAEPVGGWQDWVRRAQAAAAQGDFRDAIRIIYGAAVRRIEAAGAWQVDPARTHREYVRLLPASSLHRAPLEAITTCFERVWYGHAQASAAEYRAVLTELESLP